MKMTSQNSLWGLSLQQSKKGKNAFEIRMQDSTVITLAAETEAEQRDWIAAIKKVISQDNISQRSAKDGT